MTDVTATDQLSLVFSALADPTRRTILAELTRGDATVTELTAPLPISMPAVSRHLKVLERAALISRSRQGKWQRSHLEAAPLREAVSWMERFRGFWDSSFDRLDAHLATMQARAEEPELTSTPSRPRRSHACSTRRVSSSTGPSPTRSTWRPGGDRRAVFGRSTRWTSTSVQAASSGSSWCSPTTRPSERRCTSTSPT